MSGFGQDRFDLAHPLRLDDRGRLAPASYSAHVYSLIEQLLFTMPGERVNRPDFGTHLRQLVFENPGSPRIDELTHHVTGALQRHLAGVVQVEHVDVTVDEDGVIVVQLRYRVVASQQTEQRVFRS